MTAPVVSGFLSLDAALLSTLIRVILPVHCGIVPRPEPAQNSRGADGFIQIRVAPSLSMGTIRILAGPQLPSEQARPACRVGCLLIAR